MADSRTTCCHRAYGRGRTIRRLRRLLSLKKYFILWWLSLGNLGDYSACPPPPSPLSHSKRAQTPQGVIGRGGWGARASAMVAELTS